MAKNGIFPKQNIKNVRYEYLKYFSPRGEKFVLSDKVKGIVSFSHYDLLDRKNMAPPECVTADFDIVFCRNVLIYFTPQFQEKVLSKLYRSLNSGGYLVLGEAEAPSLTYQKYFKKADDCCPIYQKI